MTLPDRASRWVTWQAERRPDAPAIVDGDETLSYAGLEHASNRVAELLAALGCSTGDRVAVLARKSARAVVSLVGIYKAGAVLVPLDAGTPAPRLARILGSSGCRLLLAGPGTERLVGELRRGGALGDTGVVGLGDLYAMRAGDDPPLATWADVAAFGGASPPETREARLAHILYTSGSTGEPKGVAVTHRGVVGFIDWAVRHFAIQPDERLSQHPPMHFDISFLDTLGAFAAGAALHLVPPELNLLPHRLIDFIRESRLTQWFSVPSLLTYAASVDAVAHGDLPELRRLLWAGEVFPTPALIHWMRRLPHARFANLYGPTETTIASTCYDVPGCPDDPRASIPIGRACDGEEILILDASLQPVADGEPGEIYIRGSGLADGYWRDPARTAAAFLPDPRGGEGERIYRTGDVGRRDQEGYVHLLGRADFQIKSRGYRIEPGEIESVIAATGLAEEAVVTAIASGGFENQSLCCAYVPAPSGGAAVDPFVLRGALSARLPAYMLPAHWLAYPRLPRNANGKLDRRAIKQSFEELHGAATSESRTAAVG